MLSSCTLPLEPADDAVDDGEAEARARHAASRAFAALEGSHDALALVFRKARALVADGEHGVLAVVGQARRNVEPEDAVLAAAVAHRVREEVLHGAGELSG